MNDQKKNKNNEKESVGNIKRKKKSETEIRRDNKKHFVVKDIS